MPLLSAGTPVHCGRFSSFFDVDNTMLLYMDLALFGASFSIVGGISFLNSWKSLLCGPLLAERIHYL
jgi:hypothetical protein